MSSASDVRGAQVGGVFNFALDSLNGTQIGGVMNIALGTGISQCAQVAGVLNFNSGNMQGMQVASCINVANRIDGGQIGVLNIGRKVDGFQLGLVNISDSISGIPVGLVSISAHGRFDLDLWSSDVLQFCGGLKLGTQDVYNIYSFGISPFLSNKEQRMGFGLGIGTQQYLFKSNAFLTADVMIWGISTYSFRNYELNMLNQFRVTAGYRLWKYCSIYGGPTLNVQVNDNSVAPLVTHPMYESLGQNTDVRMWIGWVAGISIF